ncbi:hypothetical protein ACS5PN_12695 [Roseateles sp. NT4]|uniref:hypothetical protein n=1 Tax=Roseateles sp. NT4 TaxID=3453715 RepID=UPI003EE8D280
MAMLKHRYLRPEQALNLVHQMPLDDRLQRSLRATIRRWVKALRDAGHEIPEA